MTDAQKADVIARRAQYCEGHPSLSGYTQVCDGTCRPLSEILEQAAYEEFGEEL